MSKSQIIGEWREVYASGFSDGPDNVLKAKRHRPSTYSMILMVHHAVAVRLWSGREEVRRELGVHECNGGTQKELADAIVDLFRQDDVRLLADRIRSNEQYDVPKREPVTPALLNGTADIYQSKEHITSDAGESDANKE